MIYLECLLRANRIQQKELAEELGIKKQNVSLWLRKKQSVPKKYLPYLANKFNVNEEDIQKNVDETMVQEIIENHDCRPVSMFEKYKTNFVQIENDDVVLIQFDEEQVDIYEVTKYAKNIRDAIPDHTVIILPKAMDFKVYFREDLIKFLEMSLENLKNDVGDN